jgi:uncharacterized DUF497 family protein
MDRQYEFNGVSFVWDDGKANQNALDHVRFEDATAVIFDPFVRILDASRNDEQRDAAIGLDEKTRVLYVVHIEEEGEAIRLISARLATTQEREFYDS